jgi:hypothetical protein
MKSRLSSHHAFFWALCIVLLVVRFGGAHWHLCYDGNESPRTVHVGDVATDDHTEPGHVDTDLNLVESGLAKHFKTVGDLSVLLFAVALLGLLVPRRSATPLALATTAPPAKVPYRLATPRAPPR